MLATNQRHPGAIALDQTSIYWINEGAKGNVVKLRKP